MERTDLANIIGIYKIGDGYVVAKDGSITVGFQLALPEYDTLSLGDFTSTDHAVDGLNLHYVLERAVKDLEEGYFFHQQDIFYYAPEHLPSYDTYLSKTVNRMYNEKQWLSCKTYLFITKRHNAAMQGNFSDAAIEKIANTVMRFRMSLSAFNPKRMETNDWLVYLRDYFSMQGRCNYDLSFQDRKFGDMMMTGISVNADFNIKKPQAVVRNAKTSNTYAQRFNALVTPICWDVACYKVLNNIIFRENPQTLRKQVHSFATTINVLGKVVAPIVEAAESIVEQIEEGEYTACCHHFNAFFMYPEADAGMINDQIDAALEKVQLNPTRLSLDFEHIFMASIGGCVSTLEFPLDMYPTFINEAIVFSNLETTYAQSQGGIVLADTHGKPCVIDVFNEPMKKSVISNRNFVELGPSGAGKSVNVNKFISDLIHSGDYFHFIIDDGASYEMLHYLLGDMSQYMRLTPQGDELSFNPFLLPLLDPKNDPEKTLTPDLEMLTSLILLLWDPDNGMHLHNDPNKIDYIKKLLAEFYSNRFERRLEYVNFTSFVEYITAQHQAGALKTEYFNFDSFELIMSKFTVTGEWGRLLNGENNSLDISPELRMYVIELKALSQIKTIYKIVLFLTMLLAKKVLRDAPTKYKIFWLDEAWKLLDDPYFGDFIKYLYKTIRKEDSGIGLIVQDVPDIMNSKHGPAIINNSDTMFFFSHEGKESGLKKYKNELSLTERDLEIILAPKKADHAVCIRQGRNIKEYFVKLSPEELALWSTTNGHKEIIMKYREQYNGNMQLAIRAYCDAQKANS